MRHNKKFNHLGRTASHRKSMLANMAISLIMHKRITTTLAKAKALKKYVEPLITRSKEDTTNSRRVVFSYLQDKEALKELFGTVAAKVGDRPGGYTRIIKLGIRKGDAAPIAFIELVDFDENMAKTETKKKTRRSRKSTKATMKGLSIIAAFVGGAAMGAAAGILFAPEKGEHTRQKICQALRKRGITLKDCELNKLVDDIAESTAAGKTT
jgi:large subunit ribosomal protein L17